MNKKRFLIFAFILLINVLSFSKSKVYLTTTGLLPPKLDDVFKAFKDNDNFILTNKDYDFEIGLIFEGIKNKNDKYEYIISSVIITNNKEIINHFLLVTNNSDFNGAIKDIINNLIKTLYYYHQDKDK